MKPWLQNMMPQHGLSKLLGKLANARLGFLTHAAIRKFIAYYGVNMQEAKQTDYRAFQTFNDFFTRELQSGARLMPQDASAIISPVDGCVSAYGAIAQQQLLQAKDVYYSVVDLCAQDHSIAQYFENGLFLTAYLSPKDYHRFHMPITGMLQKMIYVPGKLFSVNANAVQQVSNLFSRNERVICFFDTQIGKMALIAVGAMIVGNIATQWQGMVVPQKKSIVQSWDYVDRHIVLQRGDTVGHFQLGSTVILLFEKNALQWQSFLQAEAELQLGKVIGNISRIT